MKSLPVSRDHMRPARAMLTRNGTYMWVRLARHDVIRHFYDCRPLKDIGPIMMDTMLRHPGLHDYLWEMCG